MTVTAPLLIPITTKWEILEPGLLNLQTTKYYIRLIPEHTRWPKYEVTWNGSTLGFPGVDISGIERAKTLVSYHMFELLAVGVEP